MIRAKPVDAPAAEPAGLTFQEYSFTAGTAEKRGVFVKNLPVRNDGRVIHYQPPVSASRASNISLRKGYIAMGTHQTEDISRL